MFFRPKVVYYDSKTSRENSVIRYIGNRVLRSNKNFLCLSEDTILYGQTKTLGELYKQGTIFIDTYSLTKKKDKPGCYYPIQSKSQIIPSKNKEVYEIELENGKKVIATAEHKFFRQNKQTFEEVELKDLKVGDNLRDFNPQWIKDFFEKANKRSYQNHTKKWRRTKECIRCKNIIYLERKRGSSSQRYCPACKEEMKHKFGKRRRHDNAWFEWEDNLLRNFYYDYSQEKLMELLPLRKSWAGIMHRAARLGLKRKEELQTIKNRWTSQSNPMNDSNIKERMRQSLIKLYGEHPEKLLNARLKRDSMTLIEKKLAAFLDEHKIKYEWNKYVKTKTTFRFPDFKIGNLIIEADGLYWHKNKQKDIKRQRELEELGFEVLRFNDVDILKNFSEVEKCIAQKLSL